MEKKKEPALEEIFEELEELLDQMENREVSLEDSFLLYEKGIQKLKQCNGKIDCVEKKMKMMSEQGEPVEID